MSGVSVCAFRPSVYLSVKVVETGTIRKLEYGFLFAYGEKMNICLSVSTE